MIKTCERATSVRRMTRFMTNFQTNLYLYALCTVITVPQWQGFQWILTANKIILTRGTRPCRSVVFSWWRGQQNTLNHRPNSPGPSRQICFLPYHLERSKCSKVLQFEWCPQAVESEISFKFAFRDFLFLTLGYRPDLISIQQLTLLVSCPFSTASMPTENGWKLKRKLLLVFFSSHFSFHFFSCFQS